jgi:hypothetical protein
MPFRYVRPGSEATGGCGGWHNETAPEGRNPVATSHTTPGPNVSRTDTAGANRPCTVRVRRNLYSHRALRHRGRQTPFPISSTVARSGLILRRWPQPSRGQPRCDYRHPLGPSTSLCHRVSDSAISRSGKGFTFNSRRHARGSPVDCDTPSTPHRCRILRACRRARSLSPVGRSNPVKPRGARAAPPPAHAVHSATPGDCRRIGSERDQDHDGPAPPGARTAAQPVPAPRRSRRAKRMPERRVQATDRP